MSRCEQKTPSGLQCINELGHEGKHTLPTKHECHWPTCKTEVPPSLWGCKKHWFKLPLSIRNRVWETYRPGQEMRMNPSAAYIAAAKEAQRWIREQAAG